VRPGIDAEFLSDEPLARRYRGNVRWSLAETRILKKLLAGKQ
jgi:hypothetical protein